MQPSNGDVYDSNWVEVQTDSNPYFWHRSDNATTWELPRGTKALWLARRSRSKGETYYYNQATGENVWELPPLEKPKENAQEKEKREAIVKTFIKWDADASGSIDKDELKDLLRSLGIPETNLPKIFDLVDVNKDGQIDYREFVDWVLSSAPRAVYYSVFCTLKVEVSDKRTGETLSRETKVLATDKVSTLAVLMNVNSSDRCRFFVGDRELAPQNRTFAEFGVCEGDKVTALISQAAPFMSEYFRRLKQLVEREMAEMMDDPDAMIKMAHDRGKMHSYEQKRSEQYEELIPLIEKSVDHHDTSKTGQLDKHESAFFFSHYVSKSDEFASTLAEMSARMGFDMALKLVTDSGWPISLGSSALLQQKIAAMKKSFDSQKSLYLKEKDEKDAVAFKVLDVNNDGQLQKSEIVAGLIPGSLKNKQFFRALGFDIEEGARLMMSSFHLPPKA